jgi:hypothetical protein
MKIYVGFYAYLERNSPNVHRKETDVKHGL